MDQTIWICTKVSWYYIPCGVTGVLRLDGSMGEKRIEETNYLLVREGHVGDLTVHSTQREGFMKVVFIFFKLLYEF